MNNGLKFIVIPVAILFAVVAIWIASIAMWATFDNPVIDNRVEIETLEGIEGFRLSLSGEFADENTKGSSKFQEPFSLYISIGYSPDELAQSISIEGFNLFSTDTAVKIDNEQNFPVNVTIRDVVSGVDGLKNGTYTLKDVPFNFGEYRFEASGEICISDNCLLWSASGIFTATESTSVGHMF